jgi:hypothetical protein
MLQSPEAEIFLNDLAPYKNQLIGAVGLTLNTCEGVTKAFWNSSCFSLVLLDLNLFNTAFKFAFPFIRLFSFRCIADSITGVSRGLILRNSY